MFYQNSFYYYYYISASRLHIWQYLVWVLPLDLLEWSIGLISLQMELWLTILSLNGKTVVAPIFADIRPFNLFIWITRFSPISKYSIENSQFRTYSTIQSSNNSYFRFEPNFCEKMWLINELGTVTKYRSKMVDFVIMA